jgi:hypothetical protein
MKNLKKILIGLLLFLLGVMPIFTIFARPALAAPITSTQLQNGPWYVNSVYTRNNVQYPSRVVFTFSGDSFTFSDRNTDDNIFNLKYSNSADQFICDQSDASREMGITITGPRQAIPGGGYSWPAVLKAYHSNNTDQACEGGNDERFTWIDENIGLLYQVPSQPPPPGGTDPQNGGDDTSDCIAAGSSTLEWILCPVTTAIGSVVDGLNKEIQKMLKFDVNKFLPDDGGVKSAWSAFRTIATSFLVIVFLVMIISQATGRGPFA